MRIEFIKKKKKKFLQFRRILEEIGKMSKFESMKFSNFKS